MTTLRETTHPSTKGGSSPGGKAVLPCVTCDVTLSDGELTFCAVGKSVTLTATGKPAGGTYAYASTDDAIATISGTGNKVTVTSIAEGSAVITVTYTPPECFNCQATTSVQVRTKVGALIVYGSGAELGNFKVFADHLKKKLEKTYPSRVLVEHIEDKDLFFQYLEGLEVDYCIKELHIFSHSFGAGLALNYHGTTGQERRANALRAATAAGTTLTYDEVVKAEISLLTDDYLRADILAKQAIYQSKLDAGGFIKIWGCNAGIDNWLYSDDAGPVYWSRLMLKNVPKPSIARATAHFFQRNTYGAQSGAHVEVKDAGVWITSQEYKEKHGSWPSGALEHRLHPDRGSYQEYAP